jgi:cold-inducible RNA-binding protein
MIPSRMPRGGFVIRRERGSLLLHSWAALGTQLPKPHRYRTGGGQERYVAFRLFVGNLSYDVTEPELRGLFSEVGPPSSVYLATDRESGKPRGFAFVEFNTATEGEEAIRRFNDHSFKGRALAVTEARAREDRPRPGGSSSTPLPRAGSLGRPRTPDSPAGGTEPRRDFGPDASPRRGRGRSKPGPRSERAAKGPMREVVKGQIFGGVDDDSFDEISSGENFASRANDSELNDDDQETGRRP